MSAKIVKAELPAAFIAVAIGSVDPGTGLTQRDASASWAGLTTDAFNLTTIKCVVLQG